jgi:hypothetical protein
LTDKYNGNHTVLLKRTVCDSLEKGLFSFAKYRFPQPLAKPNY